MTPDRYDTMPRAELDAELARRCRSVADAIAFARSGHLHDDEIRVALRLLDGVETCEKFA